MCTFRWFGRVICPFFPFSLTGIWVQHGPIDMLAGATTHYWPHKGFRTQIHMKQSDSATTKSTPAAYIMKRARPASLPAGSGA